MRRKTQNAHRRIWAVLGILLPVIFLGAMYLKQSAPVDRPAMMIEPAGEQ